MASNLRPKKKIDYKAVHEGESSCLRKDTRARTVVLESTYYVERLISKKKDHENKTFQYLVKWQNFHIADSTWEPSSHLSQHVISNYIPADIDEFRVKSFSEAFERTVQSRLKSKNPTCVVYVDLDVFRFLFGDVTSKLCYPGDFESLKLSDHWFYILSSDGTGKKLKFPVKLSTKLRMRKMYVKQDGKLILKTVPIEKCLIYSCTETCVLDDL